MTLIHFSCSSQAEAFFADYFAAADFIPVVDPASLIVDLDLAALVGRTQGAERCDKLYSACAKTVKAMMAEVEAGAREIIKIAQRPESVSSAAAAKKD